MKEKIELVTVIITLYITINDALKNNKFNVLFYIILVLGIFLLIYQRYKEKIIKQDICKLNRELAICERKLFYSLKNSYKKDQDISTINSIAIDGLKKYVTIISKILSKYIGKEITVTIRFIEKEYNLKSEAVLTILAYSENCDKEREQYFKPANKIASSKVVGKNTDFEVLIGESRKYQLDFFYESDLQETNKQLAKLGGNGYENTTPCWEKYYNSRIVVPISMTNDILFFKKKESDDDIIGFLCADAKERKAFPKSNKEKYFYISLMETFANRIYIILNKYSYYLKKREEGVKHDQTTFRRKCKNDECPIFLQIKKKRNTKIS